LDVTFGGLTNDGDNGTYSGIAYFTFTYVKMSGGSGRGGWVSRGMQCMSAVTQ